MKLLLRIIYNIYTLKLRRYAGVTCSQHDYSWVIQLKADLYLSYIL